MQFTRLGSHGNISKKRLLLKEWAGAFIEAIAIFLLLYALFWPLKIEGNSMEHTISDSERVIMSRALAIFGSYSHGDIVVCDSRVKDIKRSIIKRIIAMPGDHLIIKDGIVSVNGEVLDEPYSYGKTFGNVDLVLDEHHVFVMGDNREVSTDSRSIGPIDKSEIVGRVILRILPFDKIAIF